MAPTATKSTGCIDGMPHHHWRNAGLDVPDDGPLAGELVTIFECPTCGRTKRRRYSR